MITKVSGGAEQMYEKEVVMPARKERFTLKQLDMQIAQAQARLDDLKSQKAEALAIKDE